MWNLTVVACVNEYDRECDAKQEIVSNGEQGDQCMCYVCMARNSQRDDVIVISECDVHVNRVFALNCVSDNVGADS